MAYTWAKGWSYSGVIKPDTAGKFKVKSITFKASGAPYRDDGYYDEGGGSGTVDNPIWISETVLTGTVSGVGSINLGTGTTSSGGTPGVDAYVHGNTSIHTLTPSGVVMAKDGLSISITGSGSSGGAVGTLEAPVSVEWDWAYANYSISYPGGTATLTDQTYGTTASFSTGINGKLYYKGNGGTPIDQLQDKSYTASWSKTVSSDDCAQYPGYVSVSTNSQQIKADFSNITQPTLQDYLFEGWFNKSDSRTARTEYLDGHSFGTHGGPFYLYAHWMSPPVWERKNGEWHKLIPDDMNAQSVKGTNTVNNVRSKHSDETTPLDKPIYQYDATTHKWVQIYGAMIPPIDS